MNARCMALLGCVAGTMVAAAATIGPLKLDKPLLAHWAFDEATGEICRDASGHQADATLDRPAPGLERVAGVFDGGLSLSGRHLLRCGRQPAFDAVEKLSFSAWVQPAAFERYNEIFRKEDGERRVLFSFQEYGHVLSLGLNINGYVECDAKLDPAQVTDGLWHHAAATFDGTVMRVYLDGMEIGRLDRPGRLVAGGPARGCIGSSDGGECFQGQMDDLRIYADALTAGEIARLHRNGLDGLALSAGPAQAALETIYAPGKTFPETLALTRRNAAEKNVRLDAKGLAMLLQRLRADFPQECQQFRQWTGADIASYLRAKGNEFNLPAAGRLVELLLEYRPLTEAQKSKQTAEERRKWDEAAALEQRFAALKERGGAAQFSPEWIELMLEAGRRIQWRPYEHEAVAPYVTPQTPSTRDWTPAEAREAIEHDWLFQADGKPTPERTRLEAGWTRELAARLGVDLTNELTALAALEKEEASPAVYLKIRALKRAIMFKNPALDFTLINI